MQTYVTHVERDFQIIDEAVIKLGKQIQHIEDVVASDFMQVAVSERSDVAIGLA